MPASPDAGVPWKVDPPLGWQLDPPFEASRQVPPGDSRLVDGMVFAMEAVRETPSLWGLGDGSLAASGEPTMIVGPEGVGKTTLMQRYALARVGVSRALLGIPVVAAEGVVLYVAADRPSQGARSFGRMVRGLTADDRTRIRTGMNVGAGPSRSMSSVSRRV